MLFRLGRTVLFSRRVKKKTVDDKFIRTTLAIERIKIIKPRVPVIFAITHPEQIQASYNYGDEDVATLATVHMENDDCQREIKYKFIATCDQTLS